MKVKISNKNGELSQYGLLCGYVQTTYKEGLYKELYKEHGVYHVRSTKHNTPKLNTYFDGRTNRKFLIWETFDLLRDARILYRKIK